VIESYSQQAVNAAIHTSTPVNLLAFLIRFCALGHTFNRKRESSSLRQPFTPNSAQCDVTANSCAVPSKRDVISVHNATPATSVHGYRRTLDLDQDQQWQQLCAVAAAAAGDIKAI
jgi:hypothetical protein